MTKSFQSCFWPALDVEFKVYSTEREFALNYCENHFNLYLKTAVAKNSHLG